MNHRLGGDLSLNDTIHENGDSAEWQDWLVDESPDQEMTLAASEDFDKRRKALSEALGILNKRDRLLAAPAPGRRPDHARGSSRRVRRVRRARAPD
jgi:DNA-directed RNA polymerase sigma subunit (sigma70/sigma32)